MDFVTLLLLFLSLAFSHVLVTKLRNTKLPPGPFPLPIIGNTLHLGRNRAHRSLAKLSKTYGPLMYLKLGTIQTIVASSPEMAREILQKHDQVCSNRTVSLAAQATNHHNGSIAYLPAGSKWRIFRQICKEHLFTAHKLQSSEALRQEKLQQLRDYLHECCGSGRIVDIGEVAFVTSLNLISTTLFSPDFSHFGFDSVQEMKGTIRGLMNVLGTPNLADYFPVLKLIDPQGIKRKAEGYFGKLLAMFDEIISERMQSRCMPSSLDYPKKNDLLEVIIDLNLESDYDLSLEDIKHFLLVSVFSFSPWIYDESSSNTTEWAMAELLRNPKIMSKAKDELKTVIGENKQVGESDISKLPYLCAMIKEAFRCYPGGPVLIPHKADTNVEINGYMVPKDSQILVNVWAMGRDSSIWSNADMFEPERFLDNEIEYRGHDFEFIPFGSGRRICPGMPLARIMVHLMVASLIHNFEWKLEPGMKPEEIDMNDVLGLSLQKAVPLEAFPIKS
ncbi:PREDICTED: ferruginol synthase-like [Erythranthe guttata]|uniref:ferruginol synthase-like n=1 Tax=Erythranthe guttata TaxID=4155 RepID=UPI00064D8A76|nr:PREDICTED: ferruginol synthase-like [Erythranthe guttata]|eukprot:XP_012851535.1 PREDICTED: ferruginol synthase-like [Erythranthe guttata]